VYGSPFGPRFTTLPLAHAAFLPHLDKIPLRNNDDESDDFDEQPRKIASLSDKLDSPSKELKVSELDEIDKKKS
jgi:poly(A)-specific ribonuclease